MSTLKQRTDAKLTPFTLAHFTAWVATKPEDEAYDFGNLFGDCAMGQYMAAHGRPWYCHYTETCVEVLGGGRGAILTLAAAPQTFGGIAARLRQWK